MNLSDQRLREIQSLYRLPGFIHTESLMAFWGCARSTVTHRLKLISERRLAVVRSEIIGRDDKRWYWIDPYIPIDTNKPWPTSSTPESSPTATKPGIASAK